MTDKNYANDLEARKRALMKLFNEGAPIAKTFGMSLSFDDENRAVIALPYNPGLDHALKGTHGGVYMTMLDTAAWFTAALVHPEDCWLATSEMSVHFLSASARTDLSAVGIMRKAGKRQDIVEASIYDGEGREVGHAVGTFILLPSVSTGANSN